MRLSIAKIALGSCLLLAVIYMGFRFFMQKTDPIIKKNDLALTNRFEQEKSASDRILTEKKPICTPKNRAVVQGRIRDVRANSNPKYSLFNTLRNPNEMLASAQRGDGFAAIALFKGIVNCYPASLSENKLEKYTPAEICSGISKELYRSRFDILEKLAAAGSIEAQTFYSINGSGVARSLLKSRDPFEVHQAKKMMALVERFAITSAQEGSKDSINLLISAYYHGHFGAPDYSKAYLYASAMSKEYPGEVPSKLMQTLEKGADKSDTAFQAADVSNCHQDFPNDQLSNPFD